MRRKGIRSSSRRWSALVRDSPDGEVAVPATIQALLAARLDQLDPVERDVLGRGSVEGRVFHRGAVEALSPDGAQLVAPLTALVRRELLRPDGPHFPGEDAFRFRHLLIRDAAYEALPKAIRAGLHERFAGWIAERGADLVELDEVVGYHLERAYRYRVALGPADEAARELSAVPPSAWRLRERGRLPEATCGRPMVSSTALSLFYPRATRAGCASCLPSGGHCSRPGSGRVRTRFSRRPSATLAPRATAGWPPTARSR